MDAVCAGIVAAVFCIGFLLGMMTAIIYYERRQP